VHYWADLQSVHGFRCYNSIAPNAKYHRVLVLALCLVTFELYFGRLFLPRTSLNFSRCTFYIALVGKTIPNTSRARLVVCSLYPMCDVSVTYMLSVFSAVAIIVACRAMSQLPDDDWYQTDHWRVACCIWYTEEVIGRGV